MLRFIFRFFAVIGFLVVAGIAAATWFVVSHEDETPERIVLSLDLSRPPAETAAGGLEGAFDRRAALTDALDALERAESDPRVKGLIARFGGDVFGYAKAHDLRAAVERFRAAGKFTLAYADSFGEGQSGAVALSTAAAFEEVWMQPMGFVSFLWPGMEVPFAKDALAALGVAPQVEKREAYKTFADVFTESGLTPQHREMLTALTGGLGEELVSATARGRKLPPDAVRALLNQGPLSEAQATAGRLIDRAAYRDEAFAEVKRRAGPGATLMHPLDYLDAAGRPHDDGAVVAVVHAVGTISDGEKSKTDLGGLNADAGRLVKAFEDAAKDETVRAVLFRIDSPGGSATASETIRRALVQVKKAGKPVIVSMGDYAASGGYWIAMDADRIIAAPGTLTGSIGVVAGKFPLRDGLARLGLNWESVGAGPGAGFWSQVTPWNDAERARMTALTDEIYAAFLRKVGEARHMPADSVRAAAQGRVWTGAQALERGLVDELGGRREALAAVRAAARLPAGAKLDLRPFPAPPSPLEEILSLLSDDGGGVADLLRAAARLSALATQVDRLTAGGAAAFSPVPALVAPLPVVSPVFAPGHARP